MPDFIGDDFDKAPVTVPPKDDKRGRPKKEVRDSILLRMIRPKLTEHELSEILELAKEHGSLVDLVALALKKMVNPELLTMSDLKMCLDRASQINMYFQSVATQGATPYAQIDKIVNDVANQVESQGSGNPNNPLNSYDETTTGGDTKANGIINTGGIEESGEEHDTWSIACK